MPAVVALLDQADAVAALRRGLARGAGSVVICRSAAALEPAIHQRWTDAVVVGTHQAQKIPLAALRERFPAVPLLTYGALRADDAPLLVGWHRLGVAAVLVAGVDDPVIGDLVTRHTATAARRRALRDAPRVLRLTEPIQVAAWEILMEHPGVPLETGWIAGRLGCSREHLSRQFGAGGAPNLKRVVDFLRIVAAADLVANPGYERRDIARLLGFTSPAHLHGTVLRIAGEPLAALAGQGAEVVLGKFARVGMRSRG